MALGKTWKSKLLGATLLGFALLGIFFWSKIRSEPLPAGSESAAQLAAGPFAIGSKETRLTDLSRPTLPNGEEPGSDQRDLQTTIWFPQEPGGSGQVAAGRHPLIIYSHGFSGMRDESKYLVKQLASHGYIVAAADYPLTNLRTPSGPNLLDVQNQPGDISFLIDTFLEWDASEGDAFQGRIDAERIGAMGLSLGGMTTSLVTYHPTLRDPRIHAAASIAGPGDLFGPAFYRNANTPFMMISGTADALVDYEAHALTLLDRVSNATLVLIDGASHLGFAHSANLFAVLDNPDTFGCYFVMKKIPEDDEDMPLFDALGGADAGLIETGRGKLCTESPLPPATRPTRQHRITLLAITSFFQSQFGEERADRERAAHYLREVMPQELGDVKVTSS